MDELEYEVADLDSVPESAKGFYIEKENGGFRLNAKSPEITGLKNALEHEREARRAAKAKLEALGDMDIDLAKRLLKDHAAEQERNQSAETIAEKLVAERTEKLTKQIAALELQANTRSMSQAVTEAALKANVHPDALEHVVTAAQVAFRFEEGGAVAYDPNGDKLLGENGKPLDYKGFVDRVKAKSPSLFAGNSGGGTRYTARVSDNGIDPSKMTAYELMRSSRA